MPAMFSTRKALGPTFPEITACTPSSATFCAACTPAPWVAWRFWRLSCAVKVPVSVSTATKNLALPKRGSIALSSVLPVEVMAMFIAAFLSFYVCSFRCPRW